MFENYNQKVETIDEQKSEENLLSTKDNENIKIIDADYGRIEGKLVEGVTSTQDFGEFFAKLFENEERINIHKGDNSREAIDVVRTNKEREKVKNLKKVFKYLSEIAPDRPLIDLACGVMLRELDVALALKASSYVGVDIYDQQYKKILTNIAIK